MKCFYVMRNELVPFCLHNSTVLGHGTHFKEGLPGVLGNKGTKGKYRREQALHTAGAREISIDQSGFSRREKI